MKYGFARCHHCNREFEPEEPGDVLCPSCQKDEDAQYDAVVFLEPEDERPARRGMTRNEKRQGLADRGIDSWQEYREER